MTETARAELVPRIKAWQENDGAGYDEAIGLLCAAADALATVAPQPAEAQVAALREALEAERKARSAAEAHAREASLEERDLYKQCAALRDALTRARAAFPDSNTAGPEGDGYKYAWDELTGAEQDWVKSEVAAVDAALAQSQPDGPRTP